MLNYIQTISLQCLVQKQMNVESTKHIDYDKVSDIHDMYKEWGLL